jgi:hypothetical protein
MASMLDARTASLHRNGMAEDPKAAKPAPSAREARLASALRANLRRRKAPAAAAREPEPEG